MRFLYEIDISVHFNARLNALQYFKPFGRFTMNGEVFEKLFFSFFASSEKFCESVCHVSWLATDFNHNFTYIFLRFRICICIFISFTFVEHIMPGTLPAVATSYLIVYVNDLTTVQLRIIEPNLQTFAVKTYPMSWLIPLMKIFKHLRRVLEIFKNLHEFCAWLLHRKQFFCKWYVRVVSLNVLFQKYVTCH